MEKTTAKGLSDLQRAWLPLAVIDAAREVQGSTRLQKLVFLGEVEGRLGESFRFEQCQYGPYSSDLAQQISTFIALGYVNETLMALPEQYSGRHRHDYTLTELGRRFVSKCEEVESVRKKRKKLERAMSEHANVALNDLLEYVYQRYLPGEESLNDKRLLFEHQMAIVRKEWLEHEEELIPLSLFVLAGLEQTERAMPLVEHLDNELDKQVIANASSDLLGASTDLLQVLIKYVCDELDSPSDRLLHAVVTEFHDVLRFIEEYASYRGILTPLSKLKIEDLTTEEERGRIKKVLARLL